MFTEKERTTMIKRLRAIRYDSRTDVIELMPPFTRQTHSDYRRALERCGYTVVTEVLGWPPFTHRIRCGDFDWGGDFLAEISAESAQKED